MRGARGPGAMGRTQRVMLVRAGGQGYGFSVRGGAEHRLGIFVSEVEQGSEAHLQGLQVGDQILKVCGMPVGQSTHREVVAVMQQRPRLQLKVRNGGLLPVRDRRSEPVSWRVVAARELPLTELVRKVEAAGARGQLEEEPGAEQRLQISLQGQQGLGCSICKGPVEKPGIFIQSTKAGRLAREVGLRPGDQILQCNGASFRNIEFGDAVFHLKSSRKLELVVRKGAGLELFPSESSGYDSSASSSVGDCPVSHSSGTSEKDRSDLSETGLDINHNTVKPKPGPGRPPDPPPPARTATPQNTSNHEAERRRLAAEQDRLRREAKALGEERRKFEEEKRLLRSSIGSGRSNLVGSKSVSNLAELHLPPSPRTHNMPSSPHLKAAKSPSASSTVSGDSSASSSSSGGSLAAALQSEIKRRAQKATEPQMKAPVSTGETKPILKKDSGSKAPYITDKNEKHDLLIAEFKKAHRKMFSSSPEVSEEEDRVSLPPPPPPKPGEKPTLLQKPKAPPPPPKSSLSSSSASSSPSPRPSLSTFKPVVSARSSSLTSRSLGTPGIPSPDYDITPDRSPHGHRKIFTKHKSTGGKHIAPPTVESIHRAKSLSSLVEVGADPRPRGRPPAPGSPCRPRGRAPPPGALKPALSQSALYQPSSSPSLSYMTRSAAQYRSSGALYEAATRKEAVLLDRLSPGPPSLASRLSANQPEFSKRHPDTADQLESFQVDIVKPQLEVKPPSIYFEKSSSNTGSEGGQNHRFEFLPRPCDPATIPAKEDGEEARIASKDYRAVNATLGKALEKTRFSKVETAGRKETAAALESKLTSKAFVLKKAPAPMPPILRKL